MDNILNFERLSVLGDKVKSGLASKSEKDEFMSMLYKAGKINQKQYNDYKANQNINDILKAALAVGAIVLIGHLISSLFDGK
jgi:hypothetical protein